MDPVFPAPFVKDAMFSSVCVFFFFFPHLSINKMVVVMGIHFGPNVYSIVLMVCFCTILLALLLLYSISRSLE